MHETINPVKRILRILLYAGSVACWLVGACVLYGALRSLSFSKAHVLTLEVIYICLAFMPTFMLLLGLKTRTWHWAFIAIAEVIVITLALYSLRLDYVRA